MVNFGNMVTEWNLVYWLDKFSNQQLWAAKTHFLSKNLLVGGATQAARSRTTWETSENSRNSYWIYATEFQSMGESGNDALGRNNKNIDRGFRMLFWFLKKWFSCESRCESDGSLVETMFLERKFCWNFVPLEVGWKGTNCFIFFVSSCGEECAASAARTATHRIPATFSLCLFVHGFWSCFQHAEIDAWNLPTCFQRVL